MANLCPTNEEWAAHPGAGCTLFAEGILWSDEQPAYDVARLASSIEQTAGYHNNSGQQAIVKECREIRHLLIAATRQGGER